MGKVNKIKQYLIEVENISPLRIGDGKGNGSGLLLHENRAVISGTTLAGLFRDFIEKNKAVYGEDICKFIFPEREEGKKEESKISCIYFYDAVSEKEIEEADIITRDHIKIDERSGTALENHLFNESHVSKGQKFTLTFEIKALNLREDMYKTIHKCLEDFIAEIACSKIAIGSKATFGFGLFKGCGEENKYYYKEYDLCNEKEFEEYLKMVSIDKIPKDKFAEIKIEEVQDTNIEISFKGYCENGFIIKGEREPIKGDEQAKGNSNRNTAKDDNKGDKTLAISYKETEKVADKEVENYIIPSSTIKGIVRGYSNKIFSTLGKDQEEISKKLNKIFGTGNKTTRVEKTGNKVEEKGIKGKVIFKDCSLEDDHVKEEQYNRIKVDRFTGGVYTGSVFSEKLVVVPKENPIEFKAVTAAADKTALALLLLTFRDIGLGLLTIGSGNNVGYGRFKGISININGGEYKNCTVNFIENGDDLEIEDNKYIEQFNKLINILNE